MYQKITLQEDHLDRVLADWNREQPDLDASALGIIGRIVYISKLLETRANKISQNYDLHQTDMEVLAALRRSAKPCQLTPTELMQSVFITSGAMTASLNRLEKRDFLHRSADPKDGRISLATLTQKGLELIDKAIVIRFENATSTIEIFDDFEKRQLSQLLKKMILNFNIK